MIASNFDGAGVTAPSSPDEDAPRDSLQKAVSLERALSAARGSDVSSPGQVLNCILTNAVAGKVSKTHHVSLSSSVRALRHYESSGWSVQNRLQVCFQTAM